MASNELFKMLLLWPSLLVVCTVVFVQTCPKDLLLVVRHMDMVAPYFHRLD